MEPVVKFDEGAALSRAQRAVAANDPEALAGVLTEVDSRRQQYLAQAQEEDRRRQETERAQSSQQGRLAYLDPEEARRQYVERQFAMELHAERAKACQAQGEALFHLLTDLRKQSEGLRAKVLARQLARRSAAIQEQLEAAKAALAPLREACEKVYSLLRMEEFNVQSQSTKIPMPQLSGDPGVIQKLYELRLEMPVEWQGLGDREQRVRFTMPYKGRLPGAVEIFSVREAEVLVSQGWAEPED